MSLKWILPVLALTACGLHTDKPTPSADAAAPVTAAPAFNSFTGKNLRLIGRFDRATPGRARFTWSGSALEFRFTGTAAEIALASTGQVRFEVEVDGVARDLWVEAGEKVYPLASGLAPGEHRIRLTRLTESFALVSALISDPVVDGHLLPPPPAPQRRLLVLGDSITAGYGVEGASQSCTYSHDTSNQQNTYAAFAADALGADLHALAWSGIGAWRSYGEKSPVNPTILVRHQRALADDPASRWLPTAYQPDAVLIAIGTNDFWDGSPGDAYRQAMAALIAQVQTDYPGRPVYLMVSPMLNGATRDAQKAALTSLAAPSVAAPSVATPGVTTPGVTTPGVKVLDLGKIEAAEGYGCDYHPNVVTQQRLGKALVQQLKKDLGW